METIFGPDDKDQETEEIPAGDETLETDAGEPKTSAAARFRGWVETEQAIRTIYLLFGLAVIVLLMILLQFSTQAICCGDWDGYYHIRWSALLWENFSQLKWLPEFKWLPLTLLGPDNYADHHFLFHLLQIPFLWFFEPVTAAKVAAVVYGSLAIFSVYWLLFKYKVDYLLIWLMALLTCANPFLYRMNMAKAPPLTIIFTVAGIYLLFERKYRLLLPLMFAFVWTYSLFPLLFAAAVVWTAIVGWNERKFEWEPVAYTAGGMLLGNLINPYFPNNLTLFFNHFWMKMGSTYDVSVGGEWYAYTGWQMITHLTIALVAMLIGYILFRPRVGQLPEKATFFMIFGTLLLVWMFKSKRLAEYFPPFAILFCAFSWKAFITPQTTILPEDFRRDIEPLLDAESTPVDNSFLGYVKHFAPWAIGLFLTGLLIFNVAGSNIPKIGKTEDLISSIKKNQTDDRYGEAMEFAAKNIPEGDRIFNCVWDDFPKMFFFDTRHTYVWGLDPNYLYSKNPELYKTIKRITSGEESDPGPIIKEEFGAKWVFTDARECEDFIAKLLESGWAETVHEDGEAFILKIRDQKGEPPPVGSDEATKEEESELSEDGNINANSNDNVNLPDEDEEEIEDPDQEEDDDDAPPEDQDEEPIDNEEGV
jgi:hypothetical protein